MSFHSLYYYTEAAVATNLDNVKYCLALDNFERPVYDVYLILAVQDLDFRLWSPFGLIPGSSYLLSWPSDIRTIRGMRGI